MKKKTKQIIFWIIFIIILAVILKVSGLFSIASTSESGINLRFSQPGVCAVRYALPSNERVTSFGLGDTMNFGDYKLIMNYYTTSYSLNCVSGSCVRGTENAKAGFTYQLYYKNAIISERMEFPMSDFYATLNNVKYSLNTLCLKDGKIDVTCENAEYTISKFSSGLNDCNNKPFYIIKNKISLPDDKLFSSLDINNEYQENEIAFLKLTVNNNYERVMKARLTLDYSINTFLGTASKPVIYEYDVISGINEINVPLITNGSVKELKINSKLELYDSAYSGATISVSNFETQPEFYTIDSYTKETQLSDRKVLASDYIKVKTIKFNETKVSIIPKYSDEYVKFLEMSVEEQAKYLNENKLSISEMSSKLTELGLDNSKLLSEKTQLENLTAKKDIDSIMLVSILVIIIIGTTIFIFWRRK